MKKSLLIRAHALSSSLSRFFLGGYFFDWLRIRIAARLLVSYLRGPGHHQILACLRWMHRRTMATGISTQRSNALHNAAYDNLPHLRHLRAMQLIA